MKKDKFERYIRDNRERFDTYDPPADLWSRIEARLPAAEPALPEKNGKNAATVKPLYSRRAAWLTAACLALLLGWAGTNFLKKQLPVTDPVIARVDASQARTAIEYASLIEQKQAALQAFDRQHPDIGSDFMEERQRLDAEYNRLRQELSRTPNQQEVLAAMMQNLQWQLHLLNQQMQVMQQVTRPRHEKDIQL